MAVFTSFLPFRIVIRGYICRLYAVAHRVLFFAATMADIDNDHEDGQDMDVDEDGDNMQFSNVNFFGTFNMTWRTSLEQTR